jgi:hypothetical protein
LGGRSWPRCRRRNAEVGDDVLQAGERQQRQEVGTLHERVAEARVDDLDGVDGALEDCFTMNSATTFTSVKPTRSETVKSASRSRLVRAMNCAPLRPMTANLAGVLMSVTSLKRLALSGPQRPLSVVTRMMPRVLTSRLAEERVLASSTRSGERRRACWP